jgi:hypothetical protein
MSEHEALATFHRWADNRRQRSWHVAIVRLWLAWALLQISSGCISLARVVAPVPSCADQLRPEAQ